MDKAEALRTNVEILERLEKLAHPLRLVVAGQETGDQGKDDRAARKLTEAEVVVRVARFLSVALEHDGLVGKHEDLENRARRLSDDLQKLPTKWRDAANSQAAGLREIARTMVLPEKGGIPEVTAAVKLREDLVRTVGKHVGIKWVGSIGATGADALGVAVRDTQAAAEAGLQHLLAILEVTNPGMEFPKNHPRSLDETRGLFDQAKAQVALAVDQAETGREYREKLAEALGVPAGEGSGVTWECIRERVVRLEEVAEEEREARRDAFRKRQDLQDQVDQLTPLREALKAVKLYTTPEETKRLLVERMAERDTAEEHRLAIIRGWPWLKEGATWPEILSSILLGAERDSANLEKRADLGKRYLGLSPDADWDTFEAGLNIAMSKARAFDRMDAAKKDLAHHLGEASGASMEALVEIVKDRLEL